MSDKVYGTGSKLASLSSDQKKIVGHTWLTHVKRKGSSLNETGEVVWHSLNENGDANYYDILWEDGTLERDIYISELKPLKAQKHNHETREDETPISERTVKLTRQALRELIIEAITSTSIENDGGSGGT